MLSPPRQAIPGHLRCHAGHRGRERPWRCASGLVEPLLRVGLPDRAARGRGHRGRRVRHRHRPAGACHTRAVAITPWVLLLLAFGLLLTMLRYFRKARAAVVARQDARAAAAVDGHQRPAAGLTEPRRARPTAPASEADSAQPVEANGGRAGQANGGQAVQANGGQAARPTAAEAGQAGEPGPRPTAASSGRLRPTAASRPGQRRPAGEANGTATGGGPRVTWSAAGAAGTAAAVEGRPLPPPLSSLDMLLGPKPGQAPAVEAPGEADASGAGTVDDSGQLRPGQLWRGDGLRPPGQLPG